MRIADNPAIKAELENLQLQFGNRAMLALDDYAELYGIKRKDASRHLRRRNIPATKEGRGVYISILDLATYKAKCKSGNQPLTVDFHGQSQAEEMKRRRGFNQMVERRQLGC